MSAIVVVGGGLGGMAAAARLAKLGHQVTLVEADADLGGALRTLEQDGFVWEGGPAATLLPAALRDLFRKSGRPLEAELKADLEPVPIIREHRFEDRTSVRLPGGSRAAQLHAFDELGAGLGRAWVEHVDAYGEVWEVLRRHYAEVPWDPAARGSTPQELDRLFRDRETLHKRLRRRLRDDRLALVAGYDATFGGHDLRNVPAWVGVTSYLEQCFGAWQVPGGMGRLADVLTGRLRTRKVEVLTSTTARDLVVESGRVVAVRTEHGTLDADHAVVAIDPRRLPTLRPLVERTMPAVPPVVTHLGLDGPGPDQLRDVAHEVVIHADPMLVLRRGTGAPDGGSAWTVLARGRIAEDPVTALARHGVDLREQVVTRLDLSPREQVDRLHGSPFGVLWQGRGTVRRRLGPTTPIAGVHVAGAHGAPGAGVAFVTLSGALVAQAVGPA
ncbi:NAD(P)/FAD-dependent oxidoreductase [Nocardioides sp. GY 10113]|uniref:phytoene desaturase family protein n=1 Tax=Nocardioides sp. GY 10113 TaxID=2569761 RepID=UPI0010A7C6C1|nr:FAD-dependent oxidoreductase [Nocardioides sp. GY 10113]TIC88656.1 NAD(P)/FAD-dependent oxidoreductase [Nocardioides sp. GY 10113]